MKRSFIDTADGSKSLFVHDIGETYHSKFGALQEANFVFIKNGLSLFKNQNLAILEIGFGTGLNAFVTLCNAPALNLNVHYTGIEAFPLTADEINQLNFPQAANRLDLQPAFNLIHEAPWEKDILISNYFTVKKRKMFFDDIQDVSQYDLIYFDAFGFQYQPELWSESIFIKMYNALKPNGVLVTYACRSIIKKNMQAAGFLTEKLPGPPGKREMLRCKK